MIDAAIHSAAAAILRCRRYFSPLPPRLLLTRRPPFDAADAAMPLLRARADAAAAFFRHAAMR